MLPETRESVWSGRCDFCPGDFQEGDFVARFPDDGVMCPECITAYRELEAA